MVKIRVTPTTLFFDTMGQGLLTIIDGEGLEVHNAPKGYRVSSSPAKLYALLVAISAVYDVELV